MSHFKFQSYSAACRFLGEASSWAEKLFTDYNMLPPLMPDENNNFGGSLVLDFRIWRATQG